jgi:hypothetical protein
MPDWIIRLLEQWKVVRGAPVPFAVAVLIAAGVIWGAVNWSYSGVLASKNAQIELQDRQLADLREAVKNGAPSQKSVIQVNSDLYRVQETDDVIEVFSVPSTIILPQNAPKGKSVTVKDKTGRANGKPIKIVVDGGAKIDSLSDVEIQGMYGSFGFIWDGKEWSLY